MEHPSEQYEAFQRALDALERTGVPYAITGSWAISAYGIVRATHDLDLVIAAKAEDAIRLLAEFGPPFYADELWIPEALGAGSFFNIIDGESSLKIDFWPVKDDAYSREQFARRRREKIGGRLTWVLAIEDLLLAKLRWIKLSDSELQWRDVRSVWQLHNETLDLDYVTRWADDLSVAALLVRLKVSI